MLPPRRIPPRPTMLDIQRESGLSAGAIYTYFSSKEAIVEAVADERHQRETQLVRERPRRRW